MGEDTPSPQINASKLRIGGEIAGAIFTIGSMLIFLAGIPLLRFLFPAAVLFGCGIALLRRFVRHETPGQPWLLSATEKTNDGPSAARDHVQQPGPSTRVFSGEPDYLLMWVRALSRA